jgi:hypothetical protein
MVAAMIAGCASTPDARIAADRAVFDQWPQEVQERVAVGEVEIGFIPEQVQMALGKPDRISRRTSAMDDAEVWIYEEKRSPISLSIGLGIGSSTGRRSSVGGGVSVGTGRIRYGEAARIVFIDGEVGSIERTDR